MFRRLTQAVVSVLTVGLLAACQITVEDLTPFEFRKPKQITGPETPPEKPPVTPPVTGKDIAYIMGIDGVD